VWPTRAAGAHHRVFGFLGTLRRTARPPGRRIICGIALVPISDASPWSLPRREQSVRVRCGARSVRVLGARGVRVRCPVGALSCRGRALVRLPAA
jgi:hypothetical protein